MIAPKYWWNIRFKLVELFVIIDINCVVNGDINACAEPYQEASKINRLQNELVPTVYNFHREGHFFIERFDFQWDFADVAQNGRSENAQHAGG